MSEAVTNQSLSLYGRFQDPLAAITKLGENLGKSTMLAFSKQEQGVVLAWECFATGLTPMQVMRRIHITTDGKFMMRADAMLAEFRKRGGKVKWTEHSATRVAGKWTYEGDTTEIDYTIETAQKAGYIKPNSGWMKDPEAQLQAACIRKAMRMLCPEVIVESGDPEEDYPNPAAELRMSPAAATVTTPAAQKIITPAEFKPTEPTKPAAAPVVDAEVIQPKEAKKAETPPGELDLELQKKVTEILQNADADVQQKVMAWFVAKNHIKEGQGIQNLPVNLANMIINRSVQFLGTVKAWNP